MEFLSVVSALINITDGIFNLTDKIKQTDKSEELSEWLKGTADLLESSAQDLRSGIYPHAKCAQLNYFLTKATNILVAYMGEEEANNLREMVRESYQVEKLYGQLQSSKDDIKILNLNKLDETAGTFRGAADYLKLR